MTTAEYNPLEIFQLQNKRHYHNPWFPFIFVELLLVHKNLKKTSFLPRFQLHKPTGHCHKTNSTSEFVVKDNLKA